MKKNFRTIISTILCYVMVLSMLPAVSLTAFAASYTGTGTEANPYVVSTGAELIDVLSKYNAEGVYIQLDSDITLTDTYVPGTFYGVLDGDFHKITAVTRFFSTNKGTLKNFFYTNTVQITESTGSSDGVLCNQNSGLISGVIVTGHIAGDCYHTSSGDNDVSGPSEIGIVAGYNSGTIVNCAAFGSLSADCRYGSHAGAITRGGGKVYNCYVSATVTATGGSRYGSSSSHPITLGSFSNSYYNSDLRTTGEAGGFATSEMKTQQFVDLLNGNSEVPTDNAWTMDTKNVNGGFPVLKRALNATITSSKTNVLIDGTESVTLTCSDSSAEIYYTLDGTDPTIISKRYTGPISITNDTVIKTLIYKRGLYSQIQTFSYAKVEGAGTKAQPYLIGSEADINAMKELENTAYFRITQNIAMEGEMISIPAFYGCIDGQGYTVSGVYSDRHINGFVTANYGVIQNINFAMKENGDFLTSAVFAYNNYGVVYNCHYTGNINSGSMYCVQSWNVGGLVADNYGRLEKCSFTGKVYADDASKAGGVVGHNKGDILYCSFDGEVDIASASFGCNSSFQGYVGGFVGYAEATSSVKYCTANVTSVHSAVLEYTGVYVGGFVGNSSATTIVDCTAEIGDVSYDYGYTEWGYSGTNYYTGTSSGNSIPTAHAHNFDFAIQNPICGENRQGINSCECGVQVTNSWYDSEWWSKSHTGGTATCTRQAICQTCGTAYGALNTNNHTGVPSAIVQNDTAYPFTYVNGNYISTNTADNSTSTLTVTAQSAITIDVTVDYSTEQNYDKATIAKNGSVISTVSGTGTVTKNVTLAAGDVLTIQYSKDGSVSRGSDSITVTLEIPNAQPTCTTPVICTDCQGVVAAALGHSYLTDANDATYPFVLVDGKYTSTNKANSSSATYTYTADCALKLTVEYSVSSESGCDKLTILKNGSTLYTYSGEQSGTKEIILAAGDTLKFRYSKDSSRTSGSDCAAFAITAVTVPDPCTQSLYCDTCGVVTSATGHSYVDCVCTVCGAEDILNSGTCGTNVTWRLLRNGKMIISGTGPMDNYSYSMGAPWYSIRSSVKSVVIENGVTNVGEYAFKDHEELKDVAIGNSVITIGEGAFMYADVCRVEIGDHVEVIGEDAFYHNFNLENFTLPETVRIIERSAFSWCINKLTEVVIPDSVTELGVYAFCNCDSLVSVSIGSGVTSIADDAFCHCDKLTGIWVSNENTAFSSDSTGTLYNKDKTSIIQVPNTYTGSFVIPEGVTTIHEYAFYGCTKITSITIPASISAENSYMSFYFNYQLTGIWVSEDNADFFSDAYGVLYNKDKTVLLQAPAKLSGSYAIQEGVESIGQYAFAYSCDLYDLQIPRSVTSVEANAFYSSGLQNVSYAGTSDQWSDVSIANGNEPLINAVFACHTHNIVNHEAKAPTCTEIGWDTYETCENCDYTTYAELPASHTILSHESKAPTCTEIGWDAYETCTRCDHTTYAEKAALGHSYGEDGLCANCGIEGIIASGTCGENLTWTLGAAGTLTISGTGPMTDYNYSSSPDLPWYSSRSSLKAVIIEDGVTTIGNDAFSWCENLISVTIPNSVTTIGICAFCGCSSLIGVTIGSGLKTIGGYAFANCASLTSVTIGSGVTTIGSHTFYNCTGLTGIWVDEDNTAYSSDTYGVLFNKDKTELIQAPSGISGSHIIPDTVTSICYGAFYNCTGLTCVTIPDSVTSIDVNAFDGCINLAKVIYCGTQEQWNAISIGDSNSNLTDATLQLHNSENCVCTICGATDIHTAGDAVVENIAAADCVNNGSYDSVIYCATCGEEISRSTVVVPALGHGLTNHEPKAPTCTEIGWDAYETCTRCDHTTYAEKAALDHDLVNHEAKAPTCTAIGWDAYETCTRCDHTTYAEKAALGHDLIPHDAKAPTCTEIGWDAYETCTRCDHTTYAEKAALGHSYGEDGLCANCGIEGIIASGTCGENLTWTLGAAGTLTISGTGAMEDYGSAETPWDSNRDSVKQVVIEDGVTTIGHYAFRKCTGLTSVTIGNSVIYIGDHAFRYCASLTSVTIGNSVTTIGNYAFKYCTSLTSVTIGIGVTTIGDDAFYACDSLTGIWVDADNANYSSDSYGVLFNKDKSKLIQAPGGISGSYTIPDSVTTIGDNAFDYCKGLTSVEIPNSVTTIGDDVFYACESLTGIWVDADNANYSSDSYGVLFDKNKTTLIHAPGAIAGAYTIPDGVTTIGDFAFWHCSSLTSITIGKSVTSIGYAAFLGCSGLLDLGIPKSVISIDGWAFASCTGLTSITIPKGVNSISYSAFSGCRNLTVVVLPDSITTIELSAFVRCYDLTTVIYCGTQAQWDLIAIDNGNESLTNATLQFHNYENCSCTICGADSHAAGDAVVENTVAADCTNAGSYDSVIYCATCGEEISRETVVVPALNHDLTNYDAKAPTCTEIGWDAYETCSRCDHTTYAEKAALGHTYTDGYCITCNQPDPDYVVGENDPQIFVESKKAVKGSEFAVTVQIKNNPGFCYLELTPVIDPALTLVKVENGQLITDFTKGMQYVWVADGDVTADGVLLTFTFSVADTVESGSYKIGFNVRTCGNYAEEAVTLYVAAGAIEVIDYIFGDATGDGVIDGMDVIRLKKYLANYNYETGESTVEISAGADATGDGVVDGFDVIRLKKYLANYNYETGTSTIPLGPQ